MKTQNEKLRNQSHSPLQQKELNLGINFCKETKELYTENYQTLMKVIKEKKKQRNPDQKRSKALSVCR